MKTQILKTLLICLLFLSFSCKKEKELDNIYPTQNITYFNFYDNGTGSSDTKKVGLQTDSYIRAEKNIQVTLVKNDGSFSEGEFIFLKTDSTMQMSGINTYMKISDDYLYLNGSDTLFVKYWSIETDTNKKGDDFVSYKKFYFKK